MLFEKYKDKFSTIITAICNAKMNHKMAHAYLLHSDSPTIRQEFATLISQIALCPNTENAKPCGQCKVCQQLQTEAYPELYTLSPIGKMWQIPIGDRKNPDVNTLRWFEKQFHFTSSGAARLKVGIIHDCDRMNVESQNAFLKTLEEPPPNSFFILTTANPAALLPTTRSRCQALPLLQNNCNFESIDTDNKLFKELAELQFQAQNNIAKAEQQTCAIIEMSKSLKDRVSEQVTAQWSERLETAKELEPPIRKRIENQYQAQLTGEYIKSRNYFISAIYTWFAQVYAIACGANSNDLANPEIFAEIELPKQIDQEHALNALSSAEKLVNSLRFNVNEELVFRSCLLNIAFNDA